MESAPKYPITVQLTGNDGNAMVIMGAVRRALKRYGVSADEIAEYTEASMSGDYDNLIRVACQWVDVQ